MKGQKENLDSDAHNFGKRVFVTSDGKLFKHRDVTAEFIFLSEISPIHQKINGFFQGLSSKTALLPSLKFCPRNDQGPSLAPREIELLRTNPWNRPLREKELLHVGSMISLIAWTGLTDCHRSNFILGEDATGEFVFSPMDWETVLTTINHPYELGLFGCVQEEGATFYNNYALSFLIPHLSEDNSVAMALRGHLEMNRILAQETFAMREILSPKKDFVRRVILRHTNHYLKKTWKSPLIPEEKIQLDRGDIPYFFQIGESKDIYYWKSETEFSRVVSVGFPYIGNFRPFGFDGMDMDKLLLSTARSLDHQPKKNYLSTEGGIEVYFKENSIVINFEGRTLSCHRFNSL